MVEGKEVIIDESDEEYPYESSHSSDIDLDDDQEERKITMPRSATTVVPSHQLER